MNWLLGLGIFAAGSVAGMIMMAICSAAGRGSEQERIEAPWIKRTLELTGELEDAGLEIKSLRMHLSVLDAVGLCSPQAGCECPADLEVEEPGAGLVPTIGREELGVKLEALERKHGMTSREFYHQWKMGRAPQIVDGLRWVMLFECWSEDAVSVADGQQC